MSDKPTKYYSSLQEKMIADYLGWSVVSASGARHFEPGDIKSSEWLAECKTHTKETDNVVIDKEVWKKIANEARGKMRKPVLFVDNGTQELKNTWAIFPKRLYYNDDIELITPKFSESTKKITFKHSIFSKEFSKINQGCLISVNSDSLLVVKAIAFKELILESE